MQKKIKVLKKHPGVLNAIIFLWLSFLFLALQLSLQSHIPFINFDFLIKFINREWPLSIVAFFLTVSLAGYHSSSRMLFRCFVILVAFRSLQGLFLDFNKLVFLILFALVSISYIFDQLLSTVFNKSFYAPLYSEQSLFPPRVIFPEVQVLREEEVMIDGTLTNWDDEGLFVRGKPTGLLRPEIVSVQISYGGKTFLFKGQVVSISDDLFGCGIIILEKQTNVDWSDFIRLLDELGLNPKFTR
jgi:hypothetical protein